MNPFSLPQLCKDRLHEGDKIEKNRLLLCITLGLDKNLTLEKAKYLLLFNH